MTERLLIIRDANREIHGQVREGFDECAYSALSAEPETIEELDRALERFVRPTEWSNFRGFADGLPAEPFGPGTMLIDLAGRFCVRDATEPEFLQRGQLAYLDDRCEHERFIPYQIPSDWQVIFEFDGWRETAERRRAERAANPPLDIRPVLYGRPFLEFIATECLREVQAMPVRGPVPEDDPSMVARTDGRPDESGVRPHDDPARDVVRQIHVRWMMTPRDDLRGKMPREWMVGRGRHADRDMTDRQYEWSRLGRCPRGLDEESFAFRYAPVGTHEFVMYYEMARNLLWQCWDRLEERRTAGELGNPSGPSAVTAGDFLTLEVPRLERLRDEFLNSPDPEFHGLTPREIIDHERARVPEGMSGKDAMIDDDCPLCQMMADDSFGPMFWGLDGCNMDEDFAFAMFHPTRESYEQEQREYEEFSRKYAETEAERKRLGVVHPPFGTGDGDSPWQRSFVAPDTPETPFPIRLYGIGTFLAELTVDLKRPTEERELIDALSRDFGNLRDVVQSSDADRIEALFDPVRDRFVETLSSVAAARSDLEAKCADLQRRLQQFLDPPPPPPPPLEEGDFDVPF